MRPLLQPLFPAFRPWLYLSYLCTGAVSRLGVIWWCRRVARWVPGAWFENVLGGVVRRMSLCVLARSCSFRADGRVGRVGRCDCRIVVGTFGAQEALPGLSCKMGAHIVRLATSSAKEAAPPRCEWLRAWIRAERRLYAAPLPHAATHTALQPWRAWHQPPPGLAFAGHRLDVCT